MELREIQKSDYNLILELDAKVYPVSEENKINAETINRWYHTFPKYGMIYTNENTIVAMAIAIPMPMPTWYKLIRGECFENTLDIEWSLENQNEGGYKTSIGLHIYHIEVLNRHVVGKGFYQQMLKDIAHTTQYYQHQVKGLSGYCVTPKGNRLFQDVFLCRNADQDHLLQNTIATTTTTTTTTHNTNITIDNTTTTTTTSTTTEKKDHSELTSEFIIQHPITQQIKIVECPWNTDLTQPYLDNSVQPPQLYSFLSKCNMLYTVKDHDANISPVWTYL
ncbi:hypothetical protein PIROE2DRAFT_7369 [Piromyces sp. E2]|nr:hypothetical protein PIROE2DRAFT_7369 [Piromyces sp. E2]|eukprot:OUM65612.1 hypothetical protein PIROE2DRAFT_7369 [Piromyces sp. E2]